MKKISWVLAALATIAVAVPTAASAEGFSFRVGSDRTARKSVRSLYGAPGNYLCIPVDVPSPLD